MFKSPKSDQKGAFGPFWIFLGYLKHYLKHFFHFDRNLWNKSQNVPDTFSDTPELLGTLPDTVLKNAKCYGHFFRHPGIARHSPGHWFGHFSMISQNPIQGWSGPPRREASPSSTLAGPPFGVDAPGWCLASGHAWIAPSSRVTESGCSVFLAGQLRGTSVH